MVFTIVQIYDTWLTHDTHALQLGLLVPLESLLEHDSMRVQTYANATLYSLLREPDIRYTAPWSH